VAVARCVSYLQLRRDRTLLNVLAEDLDVGVGMDGAEPRVHLVAVLLDRRAVRAFLDGHEFLQHLWQLVVGVGDTEDDEAFVKWCEMMWGARPKKVYVSTGYACMTDVVYKQKRGKRRQQEKKKNPTRVRGCTASKRSIT
jgi:hypothetical protein